MHDRLRQRSGAAKFELTRTDYFTGDDDVWFLKFLQDGIDHRLFENTVIGLDQQCFELWQGASLNAKVTDGTQRNVPIRLNGDGLIELRDIGKAQLDYVARGEPITATSPRA